MSAPSEAPSREQDYKRLERIADLIDKHKGALVELYDERRRIWHRNLEEGGRGVRAEMARRSRVNPNTIDFGTTPELMNGGDPPPLKPIILIGPRPGGM